MKRKLYAPLLFLSLFTLPVFASNPGIWSGDLKPGLKNDWVFGIELGSISYFGDLTLHDTDPFNKLRFESKLAGGIILTKQLGNAFGVSGQLVYGHLTSDNAENRSFKTSVFEYSLRGSVDVIKLFHRNYVPRTGLYGFAGIGQFLFKTESHHYIEGIEHAAFHNTGVPEFVYFAGGGINYRFSELFSVAAELSIHQAQNDKLDNLVRNGDPDYYSLFTIGLNWTINDITNPFNAPDGKAYRDLGLTKRR